MNWVIILQIDNSDNFTLDFCYEDTIRRIVKRFGSFKSALNYAKKHYGDENTFISPMISLDYTNVIIQKDKT